MTAAKTNKSIQQFQQFFEGASDASLIIKDGVYIDCNLAALTITGFPDKSSILNATPEDIAPPLQPDGKPSSEKAAEMLDIALAQGAHHFKWDKLRFDGSSVVLDVTLTPIEFGGEQYIHVLWHDPSGQIARRETESMKQLVEKMGDAHLILKKGVYIECNQAAVDLLGYPDKNSLLKLGRENFYPEFQPDGKKSGEKAVEMISKTREEGSFSFEWMYKKYDGSPIPAMLMMTFAFVDGEEILHIIWRDITEKKAADAKIAKLAYEDDLTELANRRNLVERLEHVLAIYKRTHYIGALLFIDLDYFKKINDTMGHNVGDKLLQQVAKRLTSAVRIGDTVSRFGGDEFVLMLEDLDINAVDAAKKAEVACEKIMAVLSLPYLLNGNEVFISASTGVSMFSEDSVAKDLLQQSDIAMYQAKSAGRNTIRFFDPLMQEAINERANVEELIKNGLSNNLFELHYQTQVDHKDCVLGVEALIRLKHPEEGYIPPMQYIPAAEDTGLIIPIGKWVLNTACQQLKSWECESNTANLTIAVNVSPLEFKEEGFVINVLNAIRENDINPKLLKLELTETMLVDDIEGVITKMNLLKENGVQFSMDDFGTGYSSLQYLRQLPLNQLKIDQSFVRDLEHDEQDRSIVKTIIAMGHGLGLDVIAEGVENTQQQEMLLEYGCTNYQGYLFAKPLPINELEKNLLAT